MGCDSALARAKEADESVAPLPAGSPLCVLVDLSHLHMHAGAGLVGAFCSGFTAVDAGAERAAKMLADRFCAEAGRAPVQGDVIHVVLDGWTKTGEPGADPGRCSEAGARKGVARAPMVARLRAALEGELFKAGFKRASCTVAPVEADGGIVSLAHFYAGQPGAGVVRTWR